MKNLIKIYTLSSSENEDFIRYIGKTKDKLERRLSGHKSAAKKALKEGDTKNHNYNWMNSVIKNGYSIIIKEVDSMEFEIDEDWKWFEAYWISQFKTWGFKLNNLTDGGDGNQNQYFSKESIEKRTAKIRGIPRDEKTRKKISESNKGKKKSKEHIEHTREGIIKLQGKPIVQLDLKTGEFIKEWRCIAEAADFYGVDRTSLGRCCQGKFKKSAGYLWKYKNEYIV